MLVSKLKPKSSKLSIAEWLAHILCIEEVRYIYKLCVHLECLLQSLLFLLSVKSQSSFDSDHPYSGITLFALKVASFSVGTHF